MFLKLGKHLYGFFDKMSSDQGPTLSTIKRSRLNLIENLDPGRGWFYKCYESDYPLIYAHISFIITCSNKLVCEVNVIDPNRPWTLHK